MSGRPFGRRSHVAVPAFALAAAAAAAACGDGSTSPDAPVAIAFDSLPAPAVVVDDTLRDYFTGVPKPLMARAYNSKGELIPNAPFRYFVRDTGNPISILPGNFVLGGGQARGDSVGIVASLGDLQVTRGLFVVPRPDSLLPGADSVKTLALSYAVGATNLTDPVLVKVLHDSLQKATVPVPRWVVVFRVERVPALVADSVRLADGSGRLKTADTTDATGVGRVQVRVFQKPFVTGSQNTATDTVVVSAVARYRGADLPTPTTALRIAVPVIGSVP